MPIGGSSGQSQDLNTLGMIMCLYKQRLCMKKKVLIIDDEADQCLMIEKFLTRRNYDVDCAYSLKEGLRKLEAMHPDTLLLDNNLPDGLGWSQVRKIQRKFPTMHITLISANEASPYAITGNGIGFKQMEKPISLGMLESYL
jgi:DNA-binding response OmpR family regulator